MGKAHYVQTYSGICLYVCIDTTGLLCFLSSNEAVKNGSHFSSVNCQIGLIGLSDAEMLDGPRQESRSPFRRT